MKKQHTPYQQHAESVADRIRDSARYDATRGRWYRCGANGVWREDEIGQTEYELHQQALELDPSDDRLAGKIRPVLIHHPRVAVTNSKWDQEKFLLGTPDGVFDLDAGRLLPDGRDFFLTRQTSARVGDPAACPRWLAFLDQATKGNEDQQAFLQRWCGYCLSGYTDEHAMVFIYGTGGNGKGTFIETVQACMGDYAKTMPMESLMARDGDRHPADIAMLLGARIAVANETTEGKRWDDARIKTLTGGDTVTARFMRENYFQFVPTFKLCVLGNHAPSLGVVDDAMRRRLLVVPFDNKPKKPDHGLRDALREEASAILGWMAEGFREWREIGLNAPPVIRAATDDYLEDEDTLGQFLAECMEVEGAEDAVPGGVYRVATSEICRLYGEWAERMSVARKSARRLAGELKRRGFRYKREARWRGFLGLRPAQPGGSLITDYGQA